MNIPYIDGFDLHTLIDSWTGFDPGGIQDMSDYWWGGTNAIVTFPEGYQEGRAMRTARGLSSRTPINNMIAGQTRIRVGCWVKNEADSTSGTRRRVIQIGDSSNSFYFDIDFEGRIRLVRITGASHTDPGTVIANTVAGMVGPDMWNHYEFDVNSANGTAILRLNGEIILTGFSSSYTPGSTRIRLTTFNSLGGPWTYHYDHMYITVGQTAIQDTGVLAVSIAGANDRYEGTNGFRGALVIGGQTYRGEFLRATASSLLQPSGQDNVTNVQNWVWDRNPATNEGWNLQNINDIQAWGVCFGRTPPKKTRLAGLSLNRLVWNGGTPLVLFDPPAATAFFSGPWEKTDATKTFSAHVNQIPRDSNGDIDEVDYLLIGDEGCLLFEFGTSAPDLVGIGITFAEEFRVDMKDWVSVLGDGIPFESFFVSGYSILGEANKKFQSNYVSVNYEGVPAGGAFLQGVWDYAVSPSSGRYSQKQQVYKPADDDFKHFTRRLKVRGHGKSLQLKISNDGENDFAINGWAIFVTGNVSP